MLLTSNAAAAAAAAVAVAAAAVADAAVAAANNNDISPVGRSEKLFNPGMVRCSIYVTSEFD